MDTNILLNKKKELWYKRNCVDDNFEYIETLCKVMKIEKYKEIVNSNGGSDLLITHNNKSYKIYVEKEKMGIILLERNQMTNPKSKEYYHLVKNAGNEGLFEGSDCFYDLIYWISKRNREKGEKK